MTTYTELRGQLTNPDDMLNYILSGNGTFTLQSSITETSFTYQADTPALDPNRPRAKTPVFIRLLTGPNNESDFQYMGTIWKGPGIVPDLTLTAKSRFTSDALSVKAIRWLLSRIRDAKPTDALNFFHEGVCCCCGRKLTTPESIQRGIGPVCYSRRAA